MKTAINRSITPEGEPDCIAIPPRGPVSRRRQSAVLERPDQPSRKFKKHVTARI
jgi:hypothetical protein